MEHSIELLTVASFLLLVAGMGLDLARHGLAKKRIDYRVGQALRRGLAQAGGVPARGA